MDETVKNALLIHKAILEELINRVTALERSLSRDHPPGASLKIVDEVNGADRSARTTDETTQSVVLPDEARLSLRDSSDAEAFVHLQGLTPQVLRPLCQELLRSHPALVSSPCVSRSLARLGPTWSSVQAWWRSLLG